MFEKLVLVTRRTRLDELIARYSEAQEGSPVSYCYSAAEVRRLFRRFRILDLRKDHIFPYRIEKYVRYEYERVWYFRWLPAPVFRACVTTSAFQFG